jgi:integrase
MQAEKGRISRKTAMKIKAYLSSIFSAAIRMSETGITRNPVLGVRLPSPGLESAPAQLTADQAVRIMKELKDPSHPIAWQLAIWSGARLGELRGLRWRSVAWEQNALLIQEAVWEGKSLPPKSRKGRRRIVLTADHMRALREYKDKYCPGATDQDWVLPGCKGRPLDLEAVMTKVIKPIAKMSNMPRVHWHALRHLSNSLLLNDGVDVGVRQDRLGHTISGVNLIYSHLNDQSQLSAAEQIAKQLAAAEARLTVTPRWEKERQRL